MPSISEFEQYVTETETLIMGACDSGGFLQNGVTIADRVVSWFIISSEISVDFKNYIR